MFNPMFGMYTYMPYSGFGYSPFGYTYYSPTTVVYAPHGGSGYPRRRTNALAGSTRMASSPPTVEFADLGQRGATAAGSAVPMQRNRQWRRSRAAAATEKAGSAALHFKFLPTHFKLFSKKSVGFSSSCLRAGPADAVALLRINHHMEDLAGFFQRVRHLQRVLKEHVVVFEIVNDQKLGFEFRGVFYG